MSDADQPGREEQVPRGRVADLCAAMLRIGASLDLDTVLQEIVDGARALTGAHYGVIATVDEAGRPRDFFTSGMTSAQRDALAASPDGAKLFERLHELPAPVRIRRYPEYARSLGHATPDHLLDADTVLGLPMHHRGAHVGSFFVAARVGAEQFSAADQEVLELFAAQAAVAVANARTHRRERRARTYLEALVETSPIGVVVFDAATAVPMSVNREANRIVGGLCAPGQPPEEILDTITCRRANGREIALNEYPITEQLALGETVRAEEMTLSIPDGRSVSILVNVTSTRDSDGIVDSVIVTMQDLAPLRELERQRAEFLAMVSHELVAPLAAVKGAAATVLDAAPRPPETGEMVALFRVVAEQANRMRGLLADLLDAGRIRAGTLTVAPAPARLGTLVDQARNTFLTGGGVHPLRIDLADTPAVMADGPRIVQVLNNLFANAARHSPPSSPIRVEAASDGVHVAVSVADEGVGVPADRLPLLFREPAVGPGGRGHGLGLLICRGLVEAHGGRIRAESGGAGRGTRVTFTLPAALGDVAPAPPAEDPHPGTPASGNGRVLVLDDDPATLRMVREALAGAGYETSLTGDPRQLSALVETERPDLVLLDLVLPGADGIELMRSVPELADLPVIFISGYDRDETMAAALDAGAADYMVKPFSATELNARVRAALRRSGDPAGFAVGDLEIRHDRRRVTVAGREVPLTAKEYRLLHVLARNAGRVMSPDALLRQVWGTPEATDAGLVRAVVRKLRVKLGDDARRPTYIFNEHGFGYRMARPPDP